MEKTREKFRDKRILIWGYGREGKSTERLLREQCAPASVDVYEGPRGGVRDEDYDYVFVSPGIPFEEDAPDYRNRKFTTQTEVFLEEFGPQTIGITGTKGKSTTCSLLYTVLSSCSGRRTYLMGNIGKPCFDYLPLMDEESLAVFELSCHQCQRLQAAPHVAVFLNLYEDHLDRYHTMEHYFAAKCGIARAQTAEDLLLTGEQVPAVRSKARQRVVTDQGVFRVCGADAATPAMSQGTEGAFRVCGVDAATPALPQENKGIFPVCRMNPSGKLRVEQECAAPDAFELRIPGAHNQLNARFVYEIAVHVLGCGPDSVRAAMKTFAGLPHRLEHCGTFGGVDYYDDSISTIPQAAIRAVESVPHVRTVLIGGMDRGIDYTVLEDYIRAHQELRFILACASGKRIFSELTGEAGFAGNEMGRAAGADMEADTGMDSGAGDKTGAGMAMGEDTETGAGRKTDTGIDAGMEMDGVPAAGADRNVFMCADYDTDLGARRAGNAYYVEDLVAQVRLARRITPAGAAVVMSNAAASYGYFKDFEERGETFKRLVRAGGAAGGDGTEAGGY